MLLNELSEEEKLLDRFLTLSSFGRRTCWQIDRNRLPNEVLYSNGVIRLGTPVVLKLPPAGYPQDVTLPTGFPDDIFVGFVIQDNRLLDKTFSSIDVGSGHFTTRIPQFDPTASFSLRTSVYANSRGLLTQRPEGVLVGRCIALPTPELPFVGVVGHTEG